jgi:hypothetical protein
LKLSAIGVIFPDKKSKDARRKGEIGMTTAEQALADDAMRAEIAKLLAETSKINAEARRYPFIATAAVFGAAFAILKWVLG